MDICLRYYIYIVTRCRLLMEEIILFNLSRLKREYCLGRFYNPILNKQTFQQGLKKFLGP